MWSLKLIKYALFLVLTNNLILSGMSGDRGRETTGFPCGPHVPGLPPITANPQSNPAVAQAIENIAQSWRKKQENLEKRREESLEQPAKRRRKEKEEATGQPPQAREPEVLSTTTATTTTTSSMSRQPKEENAQGGSWAEAELGDWREISAPIRAERESSQASIWDEAEWKAVTEAIDQRIAPERVAQEYTEEWFRGFLPQIEDTLRRRDPNLINAIAQHFLVRRITVDELDAHSVRSPYTVRLSVIGRSGQQITREQIKLISQKFPNLRELYLRDTGLKDDELGTLSEQPIASQLTVLDISINTGMTIDGIRHALPTFTRLRALDVSYIGLSGSKMLRMLAEQPFAPQLTRLDFNGFYSVRKEAIGHMKAFVNLTHLSFAQNNLGFVEISELGRQPFVSRLIELNLDFNLLYWSDLEEVISSFVSLRILGISGCFDFENAGLASLAAQPFASQLTELRIRNTDMADESDTGVTQEGITAHIGAFTNLARLDLSLNNLGDLGVIALAGSPSMRNLTSLELMFTGMTDDGFAALSRAPFAPHLHSLNIAGNGEITEQGIEANIGQFTGLRSLTIEVGVYSELGEVALETLASQPFASNLNLFIAESIINQSYEEVRGIQNWVAQNRHRFKEITETVEESEETE